MTFLITLFWETTTRLIFKKICKLLLDGSDCDPGNKNQFNSPAALGRPVYIRGDFGWPDTQKYLEKNFREKQIELSIAPYFLNQDSPELDKNPSLIKAPVDVSSPPKTPSYTLGEHSI